MNSKSTEHAFRRSVGGRAKLLQGDGNSSAVCEQTSMVKQELSDVADLEAGIVKHPEVLDPKMKISTT